MPQRPPNQSYKSCGLAGRFVSVDTCDSRSPSPAAAAAAVAAAAAAAAAEEEEKFNQRYTIIINDTLFLLKYGGARHLLNFLGEKKGSRTADGA